MGNVKEPPPGDIWHTEHYSSKWAEPAPMDYPALYMCDDWYVS
jgi:hypothetical protein